MSLYSIKTKHGKKTQELLHQSGFEIISISQSENHEPRSFTFNVMAPLRSRMHPSDFLKDNFEEEDFNIREHFGIFDGPAFETRISPDIDNSSILEYTSNRVMNVIKQDCINTLEKIKQLPIVQNRMGLLSNGNAFDIPQSALLNLERDAVILSKFTGINGIPIMVHTKNEDEFIRNAIALSDNFFALRISGISKYYDAEEFSRISNALDIPVIFNDVMERAPAIAAVVANAMKRMNSPIKGKKAAIIGISTMAEMLVHLLKYLGFERVYGIDSDPVLLSKFERGEGIVATMDQAYSNSDVIIVMPNINLLLDEKRINHRQIIVSFSNTCVDKLKIPPSSAKFSFFGYDPNPFYTLPGLMAYVKKTNFKEFNKNFAVKVMKSLLLTGNEGSLLPRPNNAFIQNQVNILGSE